MRGLAGLHRAFPHAREQLRALGFLSLIIGGHPAHPPVVFPLRAGGGGLRRSLPAPRPARRRRRRGSVRRYPREKQTGAQPSGGSGRGGGWLGAGCGIVRVSAARPGRVEFHPGRVRGHERLDHHGPVRGGCRLPCPAACCCGGASMQLAGGAGLAIIMLAVFSLPVGAGLYRAEGRTDQLAPHVLASTRLVLLLVLGVCPGRRFRLPPGRHELVRSREPFLRRRLHRRVLHQGPEHRLLGLPCR